MRRSRRVAIIVLLLGSVVSFPQRSVAETIVLESGQTIEGRIIGQNIKENTITVEVSGKLVALSVMEIFDIKEVREWAGPSTRPMYGGMPRHRPNEPEIDAQFIEEATRQAGSREAASREMMRVGWAYHDQGDLLTAMKRFNQAWLLDPENPDVFWGFGTVALAKRDADEAIEMFKKAISLNPQHAIALCSLGSAYQLKAHTLRWLKDKSTLLLAQSDQAFQQGSQADPQEEFCYSAWAITLFLQGRYADAWKQIGMARRLGGKTISHDFLNALSAVMPEPQ